MRTSLIGTDAFQEADITGITLPIVKHSYLVQRVADLPRIVHEAFYLARTGRPGPVLIDVPVDITLAETEYDPSVPPALALPGYKPTVKGHPKQTGQPRTALAQAGAPVIYAEARDQRGTSQELQDLVPFRPHPGDHHADRDRVLPEDEESVPGMLGMHARATPNYAVTPCDLVFAVGSSV